MWNKGEADMWNKGEAPRDTRRGETERGREETRGKADGETVTERGVERSC